MSLFNGFDDDEFKKLMLNKLLIDACSINHVDQVRVYLELPINATKEDKDIINQMDIYSQKCKAFRLAVLMNAFDVVHYLIFDYKIKETKQIKKFIQEENASHIAKMFIDRANNIISPIPKMEEVENPSIFSIFEQKKTKQNKK